MLAGELTLCTDNAYLVFNGNCEEAFRFYAASLRAELSLTRFGATPGCEDMPPSQQDKVMHVRLQKGEAVPMASDNHPDLPYEGVKGCSVALSVDEVEEGTESSMNWRKAGRW